MIPDFKKAKKVFELLIDMEPFPIAFSYVCCEKEVSEKEVKEFIRAAIVALDKHIPKKPINEEKTFINHWLCPSCNRIYLVKEYYCSSCGQRFDID
ncbi:MAG: hypothetical protein GX660_11875 [Clostridiaceae bacterium]|nr:hypothetical protein [Clostridiaceae bacterium]